MQKSCGKQEHRGTKNDQWAMSSENKGECSSRLIWRGISLRDCRIMSSPGNPLEVTSAKSQVNPRCGAKPPPITSPCHTQVGCSICLPHQEEGSLSWHHRSHVHNFCRMNQNEQRRESVGLECPGCPREPGGASPREREGTEWQQHIVVSWERS